jgi:hypothetical protein
VCAAAGELGGSSTAGCWGVKLRRGRRRPGYYRHTRHCSAVSTFEDGIFAKPTCVTAKSETRV